MATTKKERVGFEVGRSFFPLISGDQWKNGDVKLVEAVTGYEWDKWAKLLKRHPLTYPPILQGFFAVAVQRARSLTLEETVDYIDELPLSDGIKFVTPSAKDDASPPAAAAETAGS